MVQGAGEVELQPLPLDAHTWQQLCGLLSRKLDRIDATHVSGAHSRRAPAATDNSTARHAVHVLTYYSYAVVFGRH